MFRPAFTGAVAALATVAAGGIAAADGPAPAASTAAHGAYFRDAFNFDAPGWRNVVGHWRVRDGNLAAVGAAGRLSSVAHAGSYGEFDYEVRMNRTGNSDGSAPNCLIVRANATRVVNDLWLPGYYFCYTNRGEALIVAFDGRGQRRELMDYTPVEEIGTGSGYRTARVEAVGSYFAFSVNGKAIWSGHDDLARSGQVGVGFYVEPGKRGQLAVDSANLGPVRTRAGR